MNKYGGRMDTGDYILIVIIIFGAIAAVYSLYVHEKYIAALYQNHKKEVEDNL
jgi:hypothetical protein